MTGALYTAEEWPSRQHQDDLGAGLDALLDIEAGLREILLQSRHGREQDKLAYVLDTEAGLGDILPRTTPTVAFTPPTEFHRSEIADLLGCSSISPEERMSLRSIPRVRRALDYADHALHIQGMLQQTTAAGGPHTELLGAAIEDAAEFALLAASAYDRPELARSLSNISEKALELRLLASPVSAHEGLETSLAHILCSALELVKTCVAVGHDKPGLITQATSLARQIRTTRNELAHNRKLRVEGSRPDALAHALRQTSEIVTSCYTSALLAIELRLNRRLVFGASLVRTLVEDFTTADLRQADLGGIDLTGVRWSLDKTQWPDAMDVDNLRLQSTETPSGSGIYVVQSGTATVRGYADLA